MAEIKADSADLISCGETIIALANEYVSAISAFFDSYQNLNKTAWVGASADKYVSKLPADRKAMLNFGEYLKMYGKVIKNVGVNVDRIVDKWEVKSQDV